MKKLYQGLILEITSISADIVTTSPGGRQDGDNDLSWGDAWTGNGD